MKPQVQVETVLLSKTKIKIQLADKGKNVKGLLEAIGIHYQTWAQRHTDNTWPVDRAVAMAKWIGCSVSALQSDNSNVWVR